MFVEVCRGLSRQSETVTVNEVLGNHGIHRSYVELAWMVHVTCLDKVLDESLAGKDEILESLKLLYAVNECVHRRLALGKLHRAVLVPERLVAHHRVGLLAFLGLALEELSRYLVEGVVAQTGHPGDKEVAECPCKLHLHNHVVDGQCPLTVGKLRILLSDMQVVDKVDIAAPGYCQVAPLYVE